MTDPNWEYERCGGWVFRARPSGLQSTDFRWAGEAKRGEFSADNVIFEVLFDGAVIHINHGSTKQDVLRKLKAECLS